MNAEGTHATAERAGRLIGMALFVAVLVFGGWTLLTADDGTDPAASYTPSRADAERMCREDVLRDLKAPGSARFGGIESSGDGDRWTVTGHVDAANDLGGTRRVEWSCTAVHVGGGSWRTRVSY